MTKDNNVILTVAELKEISSRLGDIHDDIALINEALNLVPSPKDERVKEAPLFMYGSIHSLIKKLFYQLRKTEDELDHYSYLLGNADNETKLNYHKKAIEKISITQPNR